MKKQLIYNFINDDELLRISNTIAKYEKQSSGEISVCIKEKKSFRHRNKSIKEAAEIEFFRQRLDKTRDKTGILIFLLLKERQFYILADAGINEKVQQDTWDQIRDEMQQMFIRGAFSQGIIYGVEKIGTILAQHFPIKPDDINEISNRVNIT